MLRASALAPPNDEGADQVEQSDEGEASPEVIQQAKDMGWVSPDTWKGAQPKNGFLSPQEYIRRGEKIMPIVRAENKKLTDALATERAERAADKAEHAKTIARIERMSTLGIEQARRQIEEKYADRKEAAVDVGDKAAYRQAEKDEKEAIAAIDDKLKEAAPEKEKPNGKAGDLPKAVTDIIDAWQADNKWYRTDDPSDEMTAYAVARHIKLQKEKKGLSLKENLEQVAADVRKRFPEEFGDVDDGKGGDEEPEKPRGSRVEGGSRTGGGGTASLWSKLPADAKAQADKFIKEDGLFLNKGETVEKNMREARERYATQYLGDDK